MNRPGTTPRGLLAMVVDDDPTMRLMLESTLAKAGMRTAAFGDARSALATFESLAPDLVLLDIGLPDIDGCALCSALRAMPSGADTPVLMLTGQDDAASVERSYESGATDFIVKPINWEILVHRVRYILRSAHALADVATSRERLADAQRVAGLGSWEWDVVRDRFQCSDEARRILGLTPDRLTATLDDFLSQIDSAGRDLLKARLVESAEADGEIEFEQSVSDAEGARRLLHVSGQTRQGASGSAALIHGTVQDVTERRSAEERIRHLAYHDSLTGLPNRTWLREELDRALARAVRHGRVLAVMFLDIDHFKRINDTLGHSVGDQLLSGVADRLRHGLRRDDMLARTFDDPDVALSRLGGDEFCIVLSELDDPKSAATTAQRLLQSFAAPFVLAGRETVISPSIGIAVFPDDASDAEGLIKAADTAMYHTKKEGRNNFCFYSPSMNARTLQRLTLESALRRAIEREQLVLHYQPVVAVETGRIEGFEALVRWQHPEAGLMLPGSFIDIAEESGLVVPLGEWVLEQACAQSSAWLAEGLPAHTMAVNVSGEQFRSASLIGTVRRVLDSSRIHPANLKLEITESVLMRNLDVTLRNLASAREMGVRLSIDDFGTGYSSLAYLERFPVDELKLDRSFVVGMIGNARNLAIAKAVLRLAHDLALSVVAEGIEDAPQRDLLKRLRCPLAQGYYYSRPQPADAITALLRTGRVLPTGFSAQLIAPA